MRSTSATMRSVSSQIRLVSSRSLGRHRLLEQLGRAADAGQRVLDLVRQHGGQRGDRAGGAAVASSGGRCCARSTARCSVSATRPSLSTSGDRRRPQKRLPMRGELERHVVLGDRAAARQHLLEQREERAVLGHELGQRMADQTRAADAEELLGGVIDVVDHARRHRPPRPAPDSASRMAPSENCIARARVARLSGAQRPCQAACAARARGRKNAAQQARAPSPASVVAVHGGAELGRRRQALASTSRDACAPCARRSRCRNAPASRRNACARRRTARRAADRAGARRCAGNAIDLGEEPRPAVAAAADHHAVGAGLLERLVDVVERR